MTLECHPGTENRKQFDSSSLLKVGVLLENCGYNDQQHIYACRSRSRWAWFGGGKQFRFSLGFIKSLTSASFNFCVFAYACFHQLTIACFICKTTKAI